MKPTVDPVADATPPAGRIVVTAMKKGPAEEKSDHFVLLLERGGKRYALDLPKSLELVGDEGPCRLHSLRGLVRFSGFLNDEEVPL